MQVGLKERLIGAAVLVILAVIIIPWVLKGGSAPNGTVTKPLTLPQATTAAAPQAAYRMDLNGPAAATGSVPAAAASQTSAAGTTQAMTANPVIKPVNTQTPAQPAAQPSPSPVTRAVTAGQWVVQAGSYGNESNARSVERKLTKHGYHAYISRYQKSGRTYYRVRVGPYQDKAAAERIVTKVSHAYGGRAQVVPNS